MRIMFQKYSENLIQKVWEKGIIILGIDPSVQRKDICGAKINRNLYGDRSVQNNNGWEIDHIVPGSKGGTDDLFNLRPLQWYNNDSRKDGPLTCPIKASN